MFSKTPHDRATAAIAEVLKTSTDDNCARLSYETDERAFSIEFATAAEPDNWVYNVAGYSGDITREDVIEAAPLDVMESGPGYVLLRSEANSFGEVCNEIGKLEHTLDGRTAQTSAKTFRMAEGSILDELKYFLGLSDD